MIKLLSHQKIRLNFMMRVSLINILVSSFFISGVYAHGVTAAELSDRRVTPDVNINPPATEEKTAEVPQGILVTGKITDETGMPVPGVNVLEKGTTNGTTSDTEGAYRITVADANATLVFSFIGYTTQEVVVSNQSTINVSLAIDTQTLSEVVVVGYGTQKKLNLTAAVDQVDGDVLNNRPMTNVTQGLPLSFLQSQAD